MFKGIFLLDIMRNIQLQCFKKIHHFTPMNKNFKSKEKSFLSQWQGEGRDHDGQTSLLQEQSSAQCLSLSNKDLAGRQ